MEAPTEHDTTEHDTTEPDTGPRHRKAAALALTLVLAAGAAACGGGDDGGSADPGQSPGGDAGAAVDKIDIEDFAFKPKNATASMGTAITWTQKDGSPHTVTAKDKSFDSGELTEVGKSFSHTFSTAGTFDYVCTIHQSMTGTVTVQ